jgi:hypothetical protein
MSKEAKLNADYKDMAVTIFRPDSAGGRDMEGFKQYVSAGAFGCTLFEPQFGFYKSLF